jgi:hypothetical protein
LDADVRSIAALVRVSHGRPEEWAESVSNGGEPTR